MQVKHKIKIDMLNPGILPKIDAVQNDANSRAVELRLYAGSEVWNVPENADVSIAFSKADNTSGLYDTLPDGSPAVEVADNVVTIILAPQVLTSPGIVSVDVKVSVGLKVVSTFPFLIRVFKDPAYNAVKSENYYKVQNWEEVNNAFESLMPIYVVLSEHDTVSNFSSSEIFGYVRSRTPVFLSHNFSYIPLSSASEEYADFELYAPTTKTKTVYRIDDACTVSIYEQSIGAVLYTAQNLTPEQKAQARDNIGAVSDADYQQFHQDATEDLKATVKTVAQDLEDASKKQARKNIDAAHIDDSKVAEDETWSSQKISDTINDKTLLVTYDEQGERTSHNAADIYDHVATGGAVVLLYQNDYFTLARATESYAEFSYCGETDDAVYNICITRDGTLLYGKELVTGETLEAAQKGIIDKLCPSFTESGSVVRCDPVEGYPLSVVSQIQPVQEGEGDPSPDNIRPITGFDSVQLWRGGKNLCNRSTLSTTVSAGNGTASSGYTLKDICPSIQLGVSYVFSGNVSELGLPKLRFRYNDSNGTQLYYYDYNLGQPITFTKETDLECQVRLYADASTVSQYVEITNLQIELGTVATSYEPYRGETFAVELGQTVYGGSLDWKTGVLTVEYGIQDLSALVWYGPEVNYNYRIYYTDPFPVAASRIAGGRKGWCSVFNCLNGITLSTLPNNSLAYSISEFSNSVRVYIKADDVADMDALMAVLEGQTLVYQLAEPITVQLTPQGVLALSGTNYLYSDTGDTTVTGRADPVAVIADLYNKINALQAAAVNNA